MPRHSRLATVVSPSGLPSNSPASTVVSSVFGKQFANIVASYESAICLLVSEMNASTAAL
jgi:hypothetical protein